MALKVVSPGYTTAQTSQNAFSPEVVRQVQAAAAARSSGPAAGLEVAGYTLPWWFVGVAGAGVLALGAGVVWWATRK